MNRGRPCSTCGEPVDHNWQTSGVKCKQCVYQYRKTVRQRHPERARRYHIKSMYGLTVEQYEAMGAEQAGACAICRSRPFTAIDHNHDTGEVRGLLCHPCNTMLGMAKDNPETLRQAAQYLEVLCIPCHKAETLRQHKNGELK